MQANREDSRTTEAGIVIALQLLWLLEMDGVEIEGVHRISKLLESEAKKTLKMASLQGCQRQVYRQRKHSTIVEKVVLQMVIEVEM